MLHIREIDHLVLRVLNLDRMLQFYCGALGCSVERKEKEIGLVQLRAGRSIIDLIPVEGKLGRAGGAAPGVEVGPVESRYGAEGMGQSIYLKDPEGNVIELKGPPGD